MPRARTTLRRLLSGTGDANIRFNELERLLHELGFDERTNGDQHDLHTPGLPEIINVQPNRGMAKVCQVRQIRQMILNNQLGGAFDG